MTQMIKKKSGIYSKAGGANKQKRFYRNEQSIGIRLSKNMELQCRKLQFVR